MKSVAPNTAKSPNCAVKRTPTLAMASPFSWPVLVPYAPSVLRRRLPWALGLHMKIAINFFAVFSLGAIAGALGIYFYFYRVVYSMQEFGYDSFASAMWTYELDEAKKQAKNPNYYVAIYSLDRAISKLKNSRHPNALSHAGAHISK